MKVKDHNKLMKIAFMQEHISVGVSFPKRVIEKIDKARGDISRSRYLIRILEEHEDGRTNTKLLIKSRRQDSPESGLESLHPGESQGTAGEVSPHGH